MSKLDLFKKQQALREKVAGRPLIHSSADPEAVAALLSTEADTARLASLDYFSSLSAPVGVDPQETRQLLTQLEEGFGNTKLEAMLAKAQRDVIGAIAGPLGLGRVLATYDKVGGNVTTVHNAKQSIYAREGDVYNRDDYTKTANSQEKKFERGGESSIGSTFTRGQLDKEGYLTDGYTGERIKASETSPDHIVSNSAFHKDGGFMLSKTERADFGTDTDNLVSTRRDINQSMNDDNKLEWVEKKSNGRSVTNEEHFRVDKGLVEAAVKRGEAAAKNHQPTIAEKGAYYVTHAAQTGVTEGLKMGVQQAFGMLMVELFSSAFEEIKQVYKHGRQSDSMLEELSIRLKRVGTNVASKWEQLIESFSGGFISGFISNAVTVLINMFVTTGKRAVRMIREGTFSLLKALKIFLFPPKDFTFEQASHEALKLLAAGGVVVGGVALEESVEKLIMSVPLFVPFASVMTAVLVGAVTAFSMTFVCYLIDKMDLFGVIRAERDKSILSGLDAEIEARIATSMGIIEEIDAYLISTPPAPSLG